MCQSRNCHITSPEPLLYVSDCGSDRNLTLTDHQIIMNTKSFPPADHLFTILREIDYIHHLNQFLDLVQTICIWTAAIVTVLWERIQVTKFSTPDVISDYFYFSVNLIGEPGDEIIGLSVYNRYIGLYDRSIVWGVLNEEGALCQS